jgi:hypothetical protein
MSHLARGPVLTTGIDGKAIADKRRHESGCLGTEGKEAFK